MLYDMRSSSAVHDLARPGRGLGEKSHGHGMSQDAAYNGLWEMDCARDLSVTGRTVDRNSREKVKLVEHIDHSGIMLELELSVITGFSPRNVG